MYNRCKTQIHSFETSFKLRVLRTYLVNNKSLVSKMCKMGVNSRYTHMKPVLNFLPWDLVNKNLVWKRSFQVAWTNPLEQQLLNKTIVQKIASTKVNWETYNWTNGVVNKWFTGCHKIEQCFFVHRISKQFTYWTWLHSTKQQLNNRMIEHCTK